MGVFFSNGAGSEARAKAEKYRKLVERLEGYTSEIQQFYDDADAHLVASHTSLISNESSAEGLIITKFDLHEEKWNAKRIRVLNNVTTGMQNIRIKISSARQLETYWLQVAEMEEMRANAGF